MSPYYRAAYKPSGNGIIELNHRTITVLSERGNISPLEVVYWYNMTPKDGQKLESIPCKGIFTYEWRYPMQIPAIEPRSDFGRLAIGDEVWVNPADGKCTSQWSKGVMN